jgi:tetratricopeptide (TPR) repeat protein
MGRIRALFGELGGAGASTSDFFSGVAGRLSWDELIHTSYFDDEGVRQLIAAHVARHATGSTGGTVLPVELCEWYEASKASDPGARELRPGEAWWWLRLRVVAALSLLAVGASAGAVLAHSFERERAAVAAAAGVVDREQFEDGTWIVAAGLVGREDLRELALQHLEETARSPHRDTAQRPLEDLVGALVLSGRVEEAIEVSQRLEIDSGLTQVALVLVAVGELDRAAEVAERIERGQEWAPAQLEILEAQVDAGRLDLARARREGLALRFAALKEQSRDKQLNASESQDVFVCGRALVRADALMDGADAALVSMDEHRPGTFQAHSGPNGEDGLLMDLTSLLARRGDVDGAAALLGRIQDPSLRLATASSNARVLAALAPGEETAAWLAAAHIVEPSELDGLCRLLLAHAHTGVDPHAVLHLLGLVRTRIALDGWPESSPPSSCLREALAVLRASARFEGSQSDPDLLRAVGDVADELLAAGLKGSVRLADRGRMARLVDIAEIAVDAGRCDGAVALLRERLHVVGDSSRSDKSGLGRLARVAWRAGLEADAVALLKASAEQELGLRDRMVEQSANVSEADGLAALGYFDSAVAILRKRPEPVGGRALALAGRALFRSQYPLRLEDRPESSASERSAFAVARARMHVRKGEPRSALDEIDAAHRIAEEQGDARLSSWIDAQIAICLTHVGMHRLARQAADRCGYHADRLSAYAAILIRMTVGDALDEVRTNVFVFDFRKEWNPPVGDSAPMSRCP